MAKDKFVTLAIHTMERAKMLKAFLEAEGIETKIVNLNILNPISSGVRIRVHESDLPQALQLIETMKNSNVEPKDRSKQILIPIDFSEYSKKICEIGFLFAQKLDAEVVLMHAYDVPDYSIFSRNTTPSVIYDFKEFEQRRNKIIKSESADFKCFVKYIKEKMKIGELPERNFITLMDEGVPEDVIIETSQKYNTALIVMGMRGKNLKEIELLGSVTAEVIERTNVPVLAIPENVDTERFNSMKNILYATTINNSMLTSVDVIMNLFKGNPFNLFFTHFEQKEDAWNEIKLVGLKDYLERIYQGVNVEYALLKLQNDDFLPAFDELVLKNNIDLIVVNTHRRSIFMRLFSPSMARKMLFHSDTPILAVRN